ncbi:MAG: GNAT family N-acetyltransferase [Butyrivibrio sp.]|uniref:GNAT family N-acetyltransferase n=1 Tax=Butyrivibrio sp. TaxID=28121 RepID=UPI0025F94FD8|nr:GNAT family N-acetyltransferase [Butyrivibrio sp.]MCR5771460.1 GNAT family N-acetyltransferase [Butyrivibrio sp.]
MVIKQLNYDEYKGKKYKAEIHSDKFLSIDPEGEGFSIEWIKVDSEIVEALTDDMLSEWLDNPVAYGAFEGDTLIGFVEGFLEDWNNRYRISNICVFDTGLRSKGVGTALLEKIMEDAVKSGARMAVLETQSYNSKAISFYKKNGFELIGFDRYAYSNDGPKEHNMRIEMGKKL